MLRNLQKVQKGNDFSKSIISDSLERMWFNEVTNAKGFILNESIISNFANFSLEMETGTGKTYVYLRAIFEMHELYGWTKFVIVVPSPFARVRFFAEDTVFPFGIAPIGVCPYAFFNRIRKGYERRNYNCQRKSSQTWMMTNCFILL